MEACEKNWDKKAIFNPDLHSCMLYKQDKHNTWVCDGRKIKNGGCRKSGLTKVRINGKFSWYCQQCDADFCADCIKDLGKGSEEKIELFPKDMAHISHICKLHFVCEDYVIERNVACKGREFIGGCRGQDMNPMRYYVCPPC